MLSIPPTHVIFDLDGTLLDTEPLYARATETVLARYGKRYELDLKRQIMGTGPAFGARRLIEALSLPLAPEAYLAERDAVLLGLLASAPPRPGAVRLVESLRQRKIPLAIATSSTRALCVLKLGSHAFATHFDAVICSDDPGVQNAKPSPDIFLRAASELGTEPKNCLVFEDTISGVRAAAAAGMRVIAVSDSEPHAPDFAGATALIDSLERVTLSSLGL